MYKLRIKEFRRNKHQKTSGNIFAKSFLEPYTLMIQQFRLIVVSYVVLLQIRNQTSFGRLQRSDRGRDQGIGRQGPVYRSAGDERGVNRRSRSGTLSTAEETTFV